MERQKQEQLLALARETLKNQFDQTAAAKGVTVPVGSEQIGDSFVTLTENGELRGCIGTTEAFEPLIDNIKHNVLSAAFSDSRFNPVTQAELENIKIEISILSQPEEIVFKNTDELLKKINPEKDGIILTADGKSATYLPQVWEQLPQKEQFLASLCQKAGLPTDRWKNPGLKIKKYQVESFQE